MYSAFYGIYKNIINNLNYKILNPLKHEVKFKKYNIKFLPHRKYIFTCIS